MSTTTNTTQSPTQALAKTQTETETSTFPSTTFIPSPHTSTSTSTSGSKRKHMSPPPSSTRSSKTSSTTSSNPILIELSTLLNRAVEQLQSEGKLPQEEWKTGFHVHDFLHAPPRHRHLTHYSSTVVKHIHAIHNQHKKQEQQSSSQSSHDDATSNETSTLISTKKKLTKEERIAAKKQKRAYEKQREKKQQTNGGDADTEMVDGKETDSLSSTLFSYASLIVTAVRPLIASSSLSHIVRIIEPSDPHGVRGAGMIDFQIQEEKKEEKKETAASTTSETPFQHDDSSFTFTSIGSISSCYKLKYGTPRQGSIASRSRATLTLRDDLSPSTLDGLEEYSHIWLVFVFHANTNKKQLSKIRPPRLAGSKVGIFATRTPHRVNPIGLSLVKLEKIEGKTLHLTGVDLIQGTPILDIKPYHPNDVAPSPRIPTWMAERPIATLTVSFCDQALVELEAAVPHLEFYHDAPSIRALIIQTLSFDPRPSYLRRKNPLNQIHGFRADRLNVLFYMKESSHAIVCAVEAVTNEDDKDENEMVDQEEEQEEGAEQGEDEQAQFKRWLSQHRGQHRDPAEYLARTISSEHVYLPQS